MNHLKKKSGTLAWLALGKDDLLESMKVPPKKEVQMLKVYYRIANKKR